MAIGEWAMGGSFEFGVEEFMDYGETAMWSTVGGAACGMLGGYASHREQYPNSHYQVLKVGKIDGIREKIGYPGIRYHTPNGKIQSIEIHPAHENHGIHIQKNTWWLNKNGYEGQYYRAFAKHLEIFKFWKGWF